MSPDDVQKEIEQLEQRFAENSKGLVFAHLADAYRRAGEYGKAEGLILHGLKNHPNYISAYNVLGRVYLDSERLGEAHQQFSRVLELDPHNLIALRALGDLAARDGEIAAARSWYERMLQVDPRNEEAREVLQKLESGASAAAGANVGEGEPAETAPEPIATEPQGGDMEDEEAAESAELQIVDSPGLESAAPPQTAAPDEGWGVGETDVVARHLEDQADTFEPVEGLLSESDLSGFDEEEVGKDAPGWEDLDEIETADQPASYLSDVTEEAAADEGGPPQAEAAEFMEQDRSEWELGDMDAWTPGLLAEEELAGETADIQSIDDHLDLNLLDEDESAFGSAADAGDASDELAGAEGVVTETMAELYAQQGLYHDALKIYEQLLEVRPNDDRIRARASELRENLDLEPDAASADDEFAALLELTESGGAEGDEGAGLDWSEVDSVQEEGESEAVGAERSESGSRVAAGMGETGGGPEPEAEDVLRESLQSTAPASPTPGGDDFEFEDEAPVAGIEHLDPFAASFNVFAKQEVAGREAAPLLPRAEEVAPIEEVQADLGSEPELEPESEVTETVEAGPEPEAEVAEWEAAAAEAPEPWIRGLAPEEADAEEVARPEAELELAGAERVGSPDEALVAEDYSEDWEGERAAPEPKPEVTAPRTGEPEVSIEEYLAALLSYEARSRAASVGEEPVETASTGSGGSLAAEGAGQGSESGAGGEGSDDPEGAEGAEGGEDLEEFQEWLRSLKR